MADWLGDLRWQGYPRLEPRRGAESQDDAQSPPAPRPRKAADARVEALARENEALRAKVESMTRLAVEFEKRLSQTASSYEDAALEADSNRRTLELERERLTTEIQSLKSELARRENRETTRDAELSLERERRAACEQALLVTRRRLAGLVQQLGRMRAKASQLIGCVIELRRQANVFNARSLQAKSPAGQDVQALRDELRDFLAKFQNIQESFGEKE